MFCNELMNQMMSVFSSCTCCFGSWQLGWSMLSCFSCFDVCFCTTCCCRCCRDEVGGGEETGRGVAAGWGDPSSPAPQAESGKQSVPQQTHHPSSSQDEATALAPHHTDRCWWVPSLSLPLSSTHSALTRTYLLEPLWRLWSNFAPQKILKQKYTNTPESIHSTLASLDFLFFSGSFLIYNI